MNLAKLEQRIGLNGHIWEFDVFANESSASNVELARNHAEMSKFISDELGARPPRLVKLQCLYPNIDRGTQRTHLYHRPGFNLDSLKIPQKKIPSK